MKIIGVSGPSGVTTRPRQRPLPAQDTAQAPVYVADAQATCAAGDHAATGFLATFERVTAPTGAQRTRKADERRQPRDPRQPRK